MKKSIRKFALTAFAAILAPLGAFAVGDIGDVVSIQAVPLNGNWETPKKVGETFYVLVRLLNEDWQDALNPAAPNPHEWVIERPLLSGDWTESVYRPALRLAIGAKKVNAELALSGPNGESNGLNLESNFYTDFYFSYTVKEGELGQPVRFVNGEDKIVDSPEGIGPMGLGIKNVKTQLNPAGYYNLTNDKGSLANFTFTVNKQPHSKGNGYPGPDTEERTNYELVYAGQSAGQTIGISVKTIDFGPAEAGAAAKDAWRLIEQNGGAQRVDPEIIGLGGVDPTTPTNAVTVYVWSDNEDVVVPVGDIEPTDDGRTVIKVTLNTDGTPTKFDLRGTVTATEGDEAWICLCSQPTPARRWLDGKDIAGSYLSKRVVIAKSVARLSISDNKGSSSPSIKATTNEFAFLSMQIQINRTVESSFVVNLNPGIAGHPELDALTNKYVVIARDDVREDFNPTTAESITNLTIDATAKPEPVFFRVYALGSCAELKEIGLTFTPTIDKDLYPEAWGLFADPEKGGEMSGATVTVEDQTPTVSVSADTEAFEGDPVEVEIEVQDNWRDLSSRNTNDYTVVILLDSEEVLRTNCTFAAESPKTFTFEAPKTKNAKDEEKTMTVRVWDGTHEKVKRNAGSWTSPTPFTLRAQPTYRAYARISYPGTSTAIDPNHIFCEGDAAQVSFAMEDANGKPIGAPRDMYAMLVPLDAMSSNLVDATVLAKKFTFAQDATNSQQSVVITLLDGDALATVKKATATVANLRFDLFDSSDDKPIPDAVVKHVTIPQLTVTNAAPTVVSVRKGADYNDPEGKLELVDGEWTYKSRVPSGVPVAFSLKIDDLGLIDATGATTRVRWEWTDGPEGDKWTDWQTVTVDTNGIASAAIAFSEPEVDQVVSIYLQDRDQKAVAQNPNDFGDVPSFTFRLKVSKMPNAYIAFIGGNENGDFYEQTEYSKTKNNPAFNVKLSEFPNGSNTYTDPETGERDKPISNLNKLIVRLTLGEFDDTGRLVLTTNYYYFGSVTDINRGMPVYFDRIEQNGGALPSMTLVHTEVMNGNVDEGYPASRNKEGIPWCEYFASSDTPVYIWNQDPMTFSVGKGEGTSFNFKPTGTNTWTAGELVTLKWTAGDIARDVTNGMFTVTAETESGDTLYFFTVTNGYPVTIKQTPLNATATGEFSFSVPSESTAVTVRADDGEGGVAEQTFWIRIVPTKKIAINPFGPAKSTQTKYRTAQGRGRGHVYVDESGSYIVRQFEQTWSFNESKKEATLFGAGYPASEGPAYDDGKMGLPNYTGAALSALGDKWTSGDYYNYGESEYDNFFYIWAQIGGEDGAGGVTYFNAQPTSQPGEVAKHKFTLDNEKAKDSETSYGTVEAEAIFSKEKYPSDNMGDINADGIPDLYMLFAWQNGMLGGIFDENGAFANGVSDLKKIDGLNDDDDVLPAMDTSKYGTFIPDLQATWVTLGSPFDAITEIRGYHWGLNDAPAQTGVPDVKPDRIYEVTNEVGEAVWDEGKCTISYVEYLAWKDSGLPAEKWSPERPSDPTIADTDGDGMPDGYEYFFWYRAHVGWLEPDGTHKYLTGRRWNPKDPANPDPIPPSVIEQIMDPIDPGDKTTINTRDTDNDGLPDLVEFELGTNPFDYDTDGDGLPDGYEVLRTETSPLDPGDGSGEGYLNPDGDNMAFLLQKEWNLVGVLNTAGGVDYYVAPVGYSNENAFVAAVAEGSAFMNTLVSVIDAGGATNKYVTTATPATYTDADGVLRLVGDLTADRTWTLAQSCGTNVHGRAAFVVRGSVLAGEPEEIELNAVKLASWPKTYYRAWFYQQEKNDKGELVDVFIRGAELGPKTTSKDPLKGGLEVIDVREKSAYVGLAHFYSYQETSFDPRTAWKDPGAAIDPKGHTRRFNHRDELRVLTFFYYADLLTDVEITPTIQKPWAELWKKYTTNPLSCDTDGDGAPDGWELYVYAGPKVYDKKSGKLIIEYTCDGLFPGSAFSPLYPYNGEPAGETFKADGDGLSEIQEYSAVESVAEYEGKPGAEKIVIDDPHWANKKWPTDPWNGDTDGDGLPDPEEQKAFTHNGGLDPCSWDTDADGLPDPWEAEFAGTAKIDGEGTAGAVVAGGPTNVASSALPPATGSVPDVTEKDKAKWPKWTWNNDGMDGTVNDAMLDYDFDGLVNWQEYMVGAMRCWRYDDTLSNWFVHKLTPADLANFTSENWWRLLLGITIDSTTENPTGDIKGFVDFNQGFANQHFDCGAYFSCASNAFEQGSVYARFYMFKDGYYHDLKKEVETAKDKKNRWTRGHEWLTYTTEGLYPTKYICCDPRLHDTDGDGFDDYYELFHGMNPLLGAPRAGGAGAPRDIVFEAWDGGKGAAWGADNCWWLKPMGEIPTRPDLGSGLKGVTDGGIDFIQYPWMAGLPEADPDGDNNRNYLEAIMVNMQAASSFLHTDPTPLWMTDLSYDDSLTRRYYWMDNPEWAVSTLMFYPEAVGGLEDGRYFWHDGVRYDLQTQFPWIKWNDTLGLYEMNYDLNFWGTYDTMFSFEENEGYDSDHDYLSDFEEGQGKTKTASDPQQHDSPLRRQAMWFGGEEDPGFLQTPLTVEEAVPGSGALAELYRQNFLYYTVECWAKPDATTVGLDRLQTLVERAVGNGAAGPADEKYLRKNFLIGLKDGRWYTKFDSPGVDMNQPVEINDGPQATTNWTHVAATYDGTALRLYVDGVCSVTKPTSIQPEHGVAAASYDINNGKLAPTGTTESVTLEEWTADGDSPMISILVGASAATMNGVCFDMAWMLRSQALYEGYPYFMALDFATTINDYTAFYRGYIDEVRIWDGARSAKAILDDYTARVRYDSAKAEENRQQVFNVWANGGSRTPMTEAQLPAQLMYHWSFDHIAGAVSSTDVLKSPAGFSLDKNVEDSMAIWARPEGWTHTWYATLDESIRSKVFTDLAWTPWINNTVAHLPRFDLTTLDSIYWSEDYAGPTPAPAAGYTAFRFARTAEVPSRWTQQCYDSGETMTTPTRWNIVSGAAAEEGNMLAPAYVFARRDRDTRGFDLLPFGSAYAKRISAAEGGMWDRNGAADPWAQTGPDSENNGLPDDWEEYARENYGYDPFSPIDQKVNYHGVQMSPMQAYRRDLARGLTYINGRYQFLDEFRDMRDLDKDGLPDWWAELYGVSGADEDPDKDGLSNYAEYLLSEVYPYAYDFGDGDYTVPLLNPTLARSAVGQQVTDYFLRYSAEKKDVKNAAGEIVFGLNEYFGEITTDHDFMEDWWENALSGSYASAKAYDPLGDKDEDGWSNWAECRSWFWNGGDRADSVSRWMTQDKTLDLRVANYPQPAISLNLSYHGLRKSADLQHPIVVRTATAAGTVDATFVIPAETEPGEDGLVTKYIGAVSDEVALHGFLSPGNVDPDNIFLERALGGIDKTYTWNWTWYDEHQIKHPSVTTGDFATFLRYTALYPNIKIESSTLDWHSISVSSGDKNGTRASLALMRDGSEAGSADAISGEFEFDMPNFFTSDPADQGNQRSVFRVKYATRVPYDFPKTVTVQDTKELSGAGWGRVKEGRNTIEVFVDLNDNGTYDKGEPFGSARNVMVGWHKVTPLAVELWDESPVMPGHAVTTAVSLGEEAGGDEEASVADLTQTLRVTRRLVNGLNDKDGRHLTERALMTKKIVLGDHPYITEADVLNVSKPDLDFSWLVKDALKFGVENIETVTYSVDQIVTFDDGTSTNVPLALFTKTFPLARPAAAAVTPVEYAPVYSASPTFTFTSTDDRATGYRLQICRAGDNMATNCLYDSGIRLLPGRTGSTVGKPAYEVTPPVFADMDVFAGQTTNRAVFADGSNYQWRVALFNAKYNEITDISDWSAWATFQLDLANRNRYPQQAMGYGSAALAVRYYGPFACEPKSIIVEAFANADFSGQPMAQIRLGGTDDLLRTIEDLKTPNAVLRGLTPGKVFFRAYVDQNDDGIRESWESWGYANMVGQGVKALHNPADFTVTASTKDFAVGSEADLAIFIEDCDTNRNEWPDCIDSYGDFRKETPYWIEPETTGGLSDDPLADTDGDGMPDNWETWTDGVVDPFVADGDFAPEAGDDVMAYLEEKRLMVTIDDGSVEGLRLLLADGETYREGDNPKANAYRYSTWYLYGPLGANGQVYGLGTNIEVTAGWNIRSVDEVTVALVHAQVYSRKGFNTLTANPLAFADKTAVDTKAFTALDRYLVMRYFEAIGATPAYPAKYKSFEEYALNAGSDVWANWSLLPGRADSNYDKIADGWQLYVMYGPDLLAGISAAGRTRATSPWGAIGDTRAVSPDGEGLSWSQEYDAGNMPTDPWHVDTDADGITDGHSYRYHLKGEQAGRDNDGDGLSNYAEYLISEVFKYAALDPDNPKTDGACVDYFRKQGDLYFGEIFTDHDQVNDLWESAYPSAANRYVYDPSDDGDGDGWSNWAEAQAGTDPTIDLETGIDGYVLNAYPVPTIETKLTYAGKDAVTAPVKVQVWSQRTDPGMTGSPDAIWTLAGTVEEKEGEAGQTTKTTGDEEKAGTQMGESVKYLGTKPDGRRSYNLGPGVIEQNSVKIFYKDLSYCKGVVIDNIAYPTKIGDESAAQWYYVAHDRKGKLYTTGGIFADEQEVGTVDYKTGAVTIDFNAKYMTGLMIGDPSEGAAEGEEKLYDLLNLDQSYVLVTWNSSATVGALNRTVYLSDADKDVTASRGWVREGLNTFIAFVDETGDGKYTPGEPFGFVRDVDVGWSGAKLDIELSRTSPVFARVDLYVDPVGLDDRVVVFGDGAYDASVVQDVGSAGTDTAGGVKTDVWRKANADQREHVRVMPYMVTGTKQETSVDCRGFRLLDSGDSPLIQPRVVAEFDIDPVSKPFISEADILAAGGFDIDWDKMKSEIIGNNKVIDAVGDVTAIRYRLVFGKDGVAGGKAAEGAESGIEAFTYLIERRFEPSASRTPPTELAVSGVMGAARPTFRWRLDEPTTIKDNVAASGSLGCSYTAFQIEVWTADGTTKVYDSGVLRAPAKNANGEFEWTAPLYAGDQTPLHEIFKAAGDWKWRVAMYNAKFKPSTRSNGWSAYCPFSTSVGTQQETDDNGYSSIDVSVKYTGPESVLADCENIKTTNGMVRIQAFTTADFSGEPVAQGFVTNKTALADASDNTANGRLIGLAAGTYYIRAYIDSNGNFRKDPWESWGAAKDAVEVKLNQLAPIVGLYIEDADTDDDWIPDAYEYITPGYEIGRSDASVDPDGRIIFKKEIYDGIVGGKAGISRFLSGATLKLFENFEAARLLLGLGGETATSTIDAIRRAVEKNIDPDSVKITSFSVDATNGKVWLTIGAKATDSIAGHLFSPIYELPATTTVTIRIYGKESLASAEWTLVKEVPVEISSTVNERIPVNTGVNFNSGFYKVEIVK